MTSIIEKRNSLHKQLANHKQQAQKLRSELSRLQGPANIGIATCMIVHEINNLLTPLTNYATLSLQNLDDKKLVEKALRKTEQNCQNATKIMESILALADGRKQEKQNVALSVLLDEVFMSLCRDFAKDGIKVDIQVPEDILIRAVPVQIQQVLMNLVLNARDAMIPGGGLLSIKAQKEAQCVKIEVKDTGTGITPQQIEKIYEPFYTTKQQNQFHLQQSGSGFGLAFCKRIIDEHNGSISVDSSLRKGTTFTITLSNPKQD